MRRSIAAVLAALTALNGSMMLFAGRSWYVSVPGVVVPIDASFAAKLVGALAGDCGPCTQLCVDIALEAGMPNDQIEAVLRRDPQAMNSATVLGFRFADAVVRRSADDGEFRDAIRAQWEDKDVIDLTLALQMGRMFPMVKAGLGYAKECRRVCVDGRNVDVIRQAA
jgi:hypothetical protein